jgi:hypothetical protein
MNLTALVPAPYRIALLGALCAALMGYGWVKGASHVQAKWDAENAGRAQAVTDALLASVDANKAVAKRQAAINAAIQKGKDDEIAQLYARLASAGRLRVGAALCGGAAAPAHAEGPRGGDEPDSPGRLVREDVDRDLKALILAVETDLATGRACQAFVKDHGFAP